MHAQTMEGLIGARVNMSLMNVPMRVYKEARRKGDTSTMERAMGYAVECGEKAKEYGKKADEGMKEDAKEAREKEKQAREKAIQERREEGKELKGRMEGNKLVKGLEEKDKTENNEDVPEKADEAFRQEKVTIHIDSKLPSYGCLAGIGRMAIHTMKVSDFHSNIAEAGLGKRIDVSL